MFKINFLIDFLPIFLGSHRRLILSPKFHVWYANLMAGNSHVDEARLIGFVHHDSKYGLFEFFGRNIISSIFLGLFWVA